MPINISVSVLLRYFMFCLKQQQITFFLFINGVILIKPEDEKPSYFIFLSMDFSLYLHRAADCNI